MANISVPYLCGGILFSLLTTVKRTSSPQDKIGKNYDGVSNPLLMAALINVVKENMPDPNAGGFSKSVSEYKTCKNNGGKNIPFSDSNVRRAFDDQVKNNYDDVLNRMIDFSNNYLACNTDGSRTQIIKNLLAWIKADESIKSDADFFINSNGTSTTKKQLEKVDLFEFEPFLIGVLHYIIATPTLNTEGLETYNKLFPSLDYRVEGKFDDSVIPPIERKITVKNSSKVSNETSDEPPNDDVLYKTLRNSSAVIFGSGGFAPDLSTLADGDILYVDNKLLRDTPVKNVFDTYLKKATEFYSNIKTLLYSEKPRLFNDFYVCNDLRLKTIGINGINDIISNVTMDDLTKISRYCIISGTGGIGKSMMMRHLFFDVADNYKQTEFLPILAPLKNYTNEYNNIVDFLYDAICEFDPDLDLDDLYNMLYRGKCTLLLDGLDEVISSTRNVFENALTNFIKAYSNNKIVISSRPTTSFIQYGHFPLIEILPFGKDKALELIDNLDFYDKEAKAKFREDLDKRLYHSHGQFASNPLLLTIMLMTYTTYGDVPAKRHNFYAKAYETMARLHDASKGAYVRPMHTNLTPEDFAVYFAEFCARTYREEVLDFTVHTFTLYMNKVINHQKRKIDATPRDFILDLTDNLCIMYKEGEKYYFIHRSFQEYFCAVFFSNQMDDKLWKIGEFFENQRRRQFGDRTFDMLYDMIGERIDRYIFLPFLRNLWKSCDENNGYWTFLDEMYPVIYYYEGDTGDVYDNDPQSYLYNFIVNETLHRHNGELFDLKWPASIDYCNREEWVCRLEPCVDKDGETYYISDPCRYDDLDQYYIDENGEPDIEGVSWEIDCLYVLNNTNRFRDLIGFMNSKDFPLKKEYLEMRQFTEELDRDVNNKPKTDDWFDEF